MNYFGFEQTVQIGRDLIPSGDTALEYDRNGIRVVYIGEAIDADSLPLFCTDSQPGCGPLSSRILFGSSGWRE